MKRLLKLAALSLGVAGIGIAICVLYMYRSVEDTVTSIYEPINLVETVEASELEVKTQAEGAGPEVTQAPAQAEVVSLGEARPDAKPEARQLRMPDLAKGDPFTLLLMGVDERISDVGRSDSIIVLSVNPDKQSILMFNIPRDTRTELVGRGTMDKINHAYAFGGIQMAVDTVENFLNIPIHYYVKVNMEGFEDIIDIVGGVEVDNPFEFYFEGTTYHQGKIHLDGYEALMYSRMRYDDPRGDLGRNDRQQEILAGLMSKAKRVSSVTKLNDVLAQIKEHARTNLTMDNLLDIFRNYKGAIDVVNKEGINGYDGRMNNIYYYMVDKSERERMHGMLIEHQNE